MTSMRHLVPLACVLAFGCNRSNQWIGSYTGKTTYHDASAATHDVTTDRLEVRSTSMRLSRRRADPDRRGARRELLGR